MTAEQGDMLSANVAAGQGHQPSEGGKAREDGVASGSAAGTEIYTPTAIGSLNSKVDSSTTSASDSQPSLDTQNIVAGRSSRESSGGGADCAAGVSRTASPRPSDIRTSSDDGGYSQVRKYQCNLPHSQLT